MQDGDDGCDDDEGDGILAGVRAAEDVDVLIVGATREAGIGIVVLLAGEALRSTGIACCN